jgi:hypothetical protein
VGELRGTSLRPAAATETRIRRFLVVLTEAYGVSLNAFFLKFLLPKEPISLLRKCGV